MRRRMKILSVLLLLIVGGCAFLPNYTPNCHFTYSPSSGYAPLTVSFDGRSSYDPDGQVVSYSWSFGDGFGASGSFVMHTYSSPGSYRACLTVRDDDGGSTTACGTVVIQVPDYDLLDPTKPNYPQTQAGARLFISDVRPPNWTYSWNLNVQYPDTSYAALRGDCDDFAVMVACFLELHWGYHTFVAWLTPSPSSSQQADHAVCFVREADVVIDDPSTFYCSRLSIVHHPDGYVYRPVDWKQCPDWGPSDYYLKVVQVVNPDTGELYYTCYPGWLDWLVMDLFIPLEHVPVSESLEAPLR